MTGRERLEGIIAGTVPPAPISEVLGFGIVEVGDGRAVFEYTPSPEHRNPMGSVHGGIAMTLIDAAAGAAVHTTLDDGGDYATVETNVHMVRPIRADDEPLRAVGEVVHRGRTLATAQAQLLDAQGR